VRPFLDNLGGHGQDAVVLNRGTTPATTPPWRAASSRRRQAIHVDAAHVGWLPHEGALLSQFVILDTGVGLTDPDLAALDISELTLQVTTTEVPLVETDDCLLHPGAPPTCANRAAVLVLMQ
jgi:hypothetical protein